MKTTIGIVGSPRKGGNTDILVRQVLAGAAAEGDETKIFYLEDLEYQGCQGCRYCKMNEGCRVDDDMTLLYQELIAANGIVLGTPVYFGQMSGQTKLFLDRWYALMNPDFSSRLPAGKKMVLVVAQGDANPKMYESMINHLEDTMGFFGIAMVETIVAAGVMSLGDAAKDPAMIKKAEKAGKKLGKALTAK
ncbi:multimeric flavodoxin WrbA [Methanolinea mesophila]|uniref:flavodoxin family protein n=1 Tax=Methanolinea mesophila TaxID=547055 RepID=UPI001AE7569C|nr:flavodoxin family protein [Methanolinea mesophila]MBP1929935.1 multimeric flavodoxin WrbA [Methanolinea mesophila]